MIDLTMHPEQFARTVERCRQRNIIIPTFRQMRQPETIPSAIVRELEQIGLWDMHPRNLFRITWKNAPLPHGGGYGGVNCLELPAELTGVKTRIIALVGKWFPTGSHKVGATFGCLAPTLITGQFDPTFQKAVWPSTGNYCRGGAYVAALLACESIALLPEEMSAERFEWLSRVAGEVIATPGCESNVKEIFDMCWELRATRDDVVIFNQFDQLGNHLWHYAVTGPAMVEVLEREMAPGQRYAGLVATSGSAGTLGSGDYMKEFAPGSRVAVSEALQCPTLLWNGFGGHRIEGIGDKHVPWIHNLRNTDMVIAVDDEATLHLLRLFNEPAGHACLREHGVPADITDQLHLLGISSIANLVSAIKMAKYYELDGNDVILTVFTDSTELYGSRIRELRERRGEYTPERALCDLEQLHGLDRADMQELSHYDRKRIHNLKYYTWIEQQAKPLAELNAQWFDAPAYWGGLHRQVDAIDERIARFNEAVGLL